MKYADLQTRLKQYQKAGLVEVKLNAQKPILETEYQRCLQLGISQKDLNIRASMRNSQLLDFISTLEIYTFPHKFLLKAIKAKTYQLSRVDNLKELKLAFPIFKDKKFDFRTKKSWSECVYLIDSLTKDRQEFEQFKQKVEFFTTSIKQEQYHQLTGRSAVEEAYDDLGNYISWWKGAQWEYTLNHQVSTLDLLKRAWLEQYLAQHNLSELLKYTPID